MSKADIIVAIVFFTIFFGGIFVIIMNGYDEWIETKELLEHCKDNGYDGIRYEEVNFFRDEPRCANFTIEEEFKNNRRRK